MTEFNLRINKVIKIFNPEGKKATVKKERSYFNPSPDDDSDDELPNDVKFYRDVYSDPNRSKDLRTMVGSVMHTFDDVVNEEAKKKIDKKKVKFNMENYSFNREEQEGEFKDEDKEYAITKNVTIAAPDVAKRPKY